LIKDKVMSTDEVINNIANFIASNYHYTHTFEHNVKYSGGSKIMEVSKDYDRESGVFETKQVSSSSHTVRI